MKKEQGRKMTHRIPVSEDTHNVYKDLTHASGVTFDALLRFFAQEMGADMKDREKNLKWGLEMQKRLEEWKKQQGDD